MSTTTTAPRRRGAGAEAPYGPNARASWFSDKLAVARAEAIGRSTQAALRGGWREGDGAAGVDAGEARARLAAAEPTNFDRRAVTSGDPGAQGFVPSGVPGFIAEAAALAARRRAALAGVLDRRPLPARGLEVSLPVITTGAGVASQATENAAVSATDIDTARVMAPVVTIAGQVDLSLQALDRSAAAGGELDLEVGAELGSALAEELDRQLVAGTGASGQLTGLLAIPGIDALTYTDASPTAAELLAKLMESRARVSGALGTPPSALLLHPRRASWLEASALNPGIIARLRELGARVVEVPSIPTSLGAGTEDVAIWIAPAELPLFAGPPEVMFFPQIGSAALTGRVRLHLFCALLAHRRPQAIGTVTGTGMVAPTFA